MSDVSRELGWNGGMAKGTRHILLLRGINVGGHGKLPMKQLRELLEELGCTDVQTYVQSGNAVANSTMTAKALGKKLEAAIEKAAGFRPPVVMRKRADLVRALKNNPYPDTEERYLHVGFLSAKPSKKALADLGDVDVEPEGYTIAGAEIYLNYVNGAGQSKKLVRVPFERKLGVKMTARNLRTIAKLIELSAP